MVLDELHVLQRGAGPVGERHPVAGLDVAVGGEREHPSAAAGAQDDGPAGDGLDPAGGQLDPDDAVHPVLVDQQRGHVPLVVAGDLLVLQRGLEQRVQQVEAGLVRREPGAHLLHAAEGADRDLAVRGAAPRAAPVLQLHQLDRRLRDEGLDRVLVTQPVAARHRVVGVLVQAVVGRDDRRSAALGRDRVAAHRVDLRHDRDAQPRVRLHDRDGGAQPGAAAAHHHHVVIALCPVHPGYSRVFGGQLVQQHPAVMPNDPGTAAAVVELVRDLAAAAGVVDVIAHHARAVVLVVAVAARPAFRTEPARS